VRCLEAKLREGMIFYNADFDPKKSDIGLKNTYKWISFSKISRRYDGPTMVQPWFNFVVDIEIVSL
jgi:hypothetical protein